MGWLRRWLAGAAEGASREVIADQRRRLTIAADTIRILEAERDQLARVVARDRERVLSETAALAAKRGSL